MPITSCPTCEIAMEVQNFEDVLIDSCPSCRGVWLDRGELHKVIAHVRRQEAEAPSRNFDAPPASANHGQTNERDAYRGKHDKPRRKRSLFDMLEEFID